MKDGTAVVSRWFNERSAPRIGDYEDDDPEWEDKDLQGTDTDGNHGHNGFHTEFSDGFSNHFGANGTPVPPPSGPVKSKPSGK